MMRLLTILLFGVNVFAAAQVTRGPLIGRVQLAAATSYDTTKVNIANQDNTGVYSSAAPDYWNNYQPNANSPAISATLNKKDGTSSGMKVQFSAMGGYNDNGSTWAAPAPFPATGVGYVGAYGVNTGETFTISSMASGTYDIIFFCSRNTASSRNMSITLSGDTQSVQAQNQHTSVITFTGKSPSSGSMVFSYTATDSFWFTNAVLIIKKS